jgi:proton-translocating NADH-quinone oxidoreductase chain N
LIAPTLQAILPEIILVVTALVVVAIDLITHRRVRTTVLAGVSIAGMLLAALAAATMIGEAPFAVQEMLAVDGFATFLAVTVLVGMAVVALYSIDYIKLRSDHHSEFYAFLLAVSLAIVLAVSANNLLMVYLAMEFLSITSYVLVGYLREDKRSSEAAIKYFLYGSIASAIMLYGMSMIFGVTGSINLNAVAQALTGQGLEGGMRWLAFSSVVLLVVGFGFKASLVPFHQWAPDTYEGAPTPITGFLSTAS